MKYLKIEASKGQFCVAPESETPEWKTIDTITKDDLTRLLEAAILGAFEMDSYAEAQLPNKAHQIIYKRLYEKFAELASKKEIFNDEIDSIYKAALEKYSVASEAPAKMAPVEPEYQDHPKEETVKAFAVAAGAKASEEVPD
jgi:hypothetical protein